MRQLKTFLFLATIVLLLSARKAEASPIMCKVLANYHMNIDDSLVSSCLDAGVGNINGNTNGSNPDLFLTGVGTSYLHIGAGTGANATNTNTLATGTFSLNASLWGLYSDIAIGFKFGTGNNPDEWFVYKLNSGVTSGNWDLVKTARQGGGLSHVILYGIEIEDDDNPPQEVPEPTSLVLLGLGLTAAGLARRRAQK